MHMKVFFSTVMFSSFILTFSKVVAKVNEFKQIEKDNNSTIGVYSVNTENSKNVT